jgi:hypothetical protein
LVPNAGLDAVLVAVELALEGAPPSGRVSEQHVINVLARLNALPRPANVATSLQLHTPPIAEPPGMTGCATCRRSTMTRDVIAEIKTLRLHGMAATWAELTERNSGEIDGARWLLEQMLRAEATDRACGRPVTRCRQRSSRCTGTWRASTSMSRPLIESW